MKQKTKEKPEIQKTVEAQAREMEAAGGSKKLLSENVQINLSDFALFLSVMKVKEVDAPILKSGKKTRYKNLPLTAIIFTT